MDETRSESWWQPPKRFDDDPDEGIEQLEPSDDLDGEADDGEIDDGEIDEFAAGHDEPEEDDDDIEDFDVDDPDDEELDEDEDWYVADEADDLDDDARDSDTSTDDTREGGVDVSGLEDYPTEPTAPVGWTAPATATVEGEGISNRTFVAGIALIVLATIIGVVTALSLGSSGDPDESRGRTTETTTTIAASVQAETTVRPSPDTLCEAERQRLQQAQFDYALGSINERYTDMAGLVGSKKIDRASTMFTIENQRPANPPVVVFAGLSANEFEDYEIRPIPGGPCDPG